MDAKERMTRAQMLHRQAFVVDGHSDILNPLADGKFRLQESVEVDPPESWQGANFPGNALRATPYQLSPHTMCFQCMGQYDIPRFQQGGVTAQVMAIYVGDEYLDVPLQRALDMVVAFHRELEDNPDTLMLATTARDIRKAKAANKTALLLSFEGAEPLERNLDLLDVFYRLGLRMVSLTHSRRNFLADGTQMDIHIGGLTHLGQDAIRRMNEMGIIIDLAHMGDVGFWEILELSSDPVLLSHSSILNNPNPRYKIPLTTLNPVKGKTKLQALADQGGVVGVIFWGQTDLDAIITEIEAVIEHVGDDYVALGSDFFGLEHAPRDLEDISKLPRLTERLLQRGHSEQTILKILGGNYLRVFEQVLGVSDG